MTHISELQFYATPEHACSYLEDMQAKTLFIDPQNVIDKQLYTQLSELGFRRSGTHIYRPHCGSCQSCISIRIPVDAFQMTRSQKRILNKNKDLTVNKEQPIYSDEFYALYERYISLRHADGDMFPASVEQFTGFLIESAQQGCFYTFRDTTGQLVAVAAADQLEKSASAVYTFYDPDLAKRSLGTFAVLWQLEQAKLEQLEYLYLGYWVEACQKMKYKTSYRPLELLINGKWLRAL